MTRVLDYFLDHPLAIAAVVAWLGFPGILFYPVLARRRGFYKTKWHGVVWAKQDPRLFNLYSAASVFLGLAIAVAAVICTWKALE